jgi:ligand-binding sensor domain-containing protein/serine phosphatase RsbU (regulator of sigma subunit)
MEQGLPQSTVFCVIQDSRGFLWVGTEGGAARFDGMHFEIFDRSNGLPGNMVRSILETTDGDIWFGTDNGIAIFNGTSWRTIAQPEGLQGSIITKLAFDNNGRIFAATNDAGVNIISTANNTFSIQNVSSAQGLSGDFVLDILPDADGKTWIAMFGGLSSITFKNNEAIISNWVDSLSLPSQYISCIDKDTEGNMWIGTLDAGAFLWKKNTSDFISYQYKNGITDSRIWDVFCDTDGSVWFATEKSGIYRFNNNRIQNIGLQNGLSGNQIFCLYRDKNQNMWLGSVGQGLSMFQGFQLVHYTLDDGLPGNQIFAIKPDAQGNLWIGSNQQGLAFATFDGDKMDSHIFSSKQGYNVSTITAIDFDNRGNLLAGTRGLGLLRFENKQFNYLSSTDGLLNNNINCVYNTPLGSIYIGSDLGFNEIAGQRIHAIAEEQGLINSEVQTIIADKNQNVWMGTMGGLARFQAKTSEYRDFNEQEGLFDLGIHALAADKNNAIWIGTNNGIYQYNPLTDTIIAFASAGFNSKVINSLLFFNDTVLIAGTNKGFYKIYFDAKIQNVSKVLAYDKSNGFKWSETNYNALCADAKQHVWFGTVNGLTCYRPELENAHVETPVVHLSDIRLSFNKVDWSAFGLETNAWGNIPQKLSLSYHKNHISFDFVGIYLKNPAKVVFKYKLEPHEKEWSPISKNTTVTYPGLTDQDFTFSVCASVDGIHWSIPLEYAFTINPPFYKTWWFLVLVGIVLLLALVVFIRWRELKLRKEKIHLEEVVCQRTAEVVAQKHEIEKQKEEITDSITYAQRIQRAVLPGFENLEKNTADCFILFKPRDIVSGDYYWIERFENNLIVAAADCTGHGVPGAFMSMLGVSFMNKIVREQHVESPDKILGLMRENVIGSLKQGDHEGSTKDGMDMSICQIDLTSLLMTFSGAYNSAIVISNAEAIELKADRMPVGYHIVMKDYTPISFQLKSGDCIYLYSDGFQDQIGGPQARKFMKKNMRELLLSIHKKPFAEQHDILDKTIEDWKNHPDGKTEQMDDILIVGFMV